MDEGARFLESIRLNPDDDDLRRVYADWLDERGDHLRAEYLRLEIAIRRGPARLAELTSVLDRSWMVAVSCRYALALVPPIPNKIQAIMHVRQLANVGLREAKELVDRARDDAPSIVVPDLEREVAERIGKRFDGVAGVRLVPVVRTAPPPRVRVTLAWVDPNRRVQVAKYLRELTGVALAEAMRLVKDVEGGATAELGEHEPAAAHAFAVAVRDAGTVRLG